MDGTSTYTAWHPLFQNPEYSLWVMFDLLVLYCTFGSCCACNSVACANRSALTSKGGVYSPLLPSLLTREDRHSCVPNLAHGDVSVPLPNGKPASSMGTHVHERT